MDGYFKQQNCKICGEKNLRNHEKSAHPQKVTWCLFWSSGVVGLYFLEYAISEAVHVDDIRQLKTDIF